jgi:hypothetical protein
LRARAIETIIRHSAESSCSVAKTWDPEQQFEKRAEQNAENHAAAIILRTSLARILIRASGCGPVPGVPDGVCPTEDLEPTFGGTLRQPPDGEAPQ